jgi:hypothetical protein
VLPAEPYSSPLEEHSHIPQHAARSLTLSATPARTNPETSSAERAQAAAAHSSRMQSRSAAPWSNKQAPWSSEQAQLAGQSAAYSGHSVQRTLAVAPKAGKRLASLWRQDFASPKPTAAPWHGTWSNSIAICASIRDENITDVREWLQYYRCAQYEQ